MKLINKIKCIALLSLITTTSFANTEWNQLIEEMPYVQKESVSLDAKGLVTLDVFKRPDGKLRFGGFKSYLLPQKMILTIHSDERDLEKLCQNAVVFNKHFKAELSFGVNPTKGNFNFILKNGETHSSAEFENQFSESTAEVLPLPNTTKIHWSLLSGDVTKLKNLSYEQGFSNLLNSAIKERTGEKAVVDLSNLNGVACDLAIGEIRPELNKTISYERALPIKSPEWISRDNFSTLYKGFWSDHSKISLTEVSKDLKPSELILIGIRVASIDQVKKYIFEAKNRPLKLLNAIKYNSETIDQADLININTDEQWKHTFDYSFTENMQTSYAIDILRDEVFVNIVNK